MRQDNTADEATRDELALFISDLHWVAPNLNDTFAYACADSEELTAGDGELLARFWRRYGWHGLAAIAAMQRGADPIPPVMNAPKYQEALKDLRTGSALREEFELEIPEAQ